MSSDDALDRAEALVRASKVAKKEVKSGWRGELVMDVLDAVDIPGHLLFRGQWRKPGSGESSDWAVGAVDSAEVVLGKEAALRRVMSAWGYPERPVAADDVARVVCFLHSVRDTVEPVIDPARFTIPESSRALIVPPAERREGEAAVVEFWGSSASPPFAHHRLTVQPGGAFEHVRTHVRDLDPDFPR